MRFFKHGDALALVLPDALRKSSAVKENDDFNWYEAEPGVFVLVSATAAADQAKKSAFLSLSRQVPPNVPAPAKPVSPAFNPVARPMSAPFKPATSMTGSAASSASVATERARLDKAGFLVLENEFEAKRLSELFANDIRQGLITGLRGFDKKFYILTKDLSSSLTPKLVSVLQNGESTLAELMKATGAPEGAVQSVLLQLKEKGDVIEKKKGVYRFVS